jgi:hypothetical protein
VTDWLRGWRQTIAPLMTAEELGRLRDLLTGDQDADRRLLLAEVESALAARIELMAQVAGCILAKLTVPVRDRFVCDDPAEYVPAAEDIEPTDTDAF